MNEKIGTTGTNIHRRTAPTLNQVKQLMLSAAADPRDLQVRTVVALVAATGIRPGELCKAKWSDVNFDQRSIFVSSKRRSRLVPFGPRVLELLQSLYEPGTGHVLGCHPERVIIRLSKSLKHLSAKHRGATFHLHELRRFFCFEWFNLGGRIESFCSVTGYRSPFPKAHPLNRESVFKFAALHQAKIENELFSNNDNPLNN